MFWVELTSTDTGEKRLFNLEEACNISPVEKGSIILAAAGTFLVTETPAQIATLMPSVQRCGEGQEKTATPASLANALGHLQMMSREVGRSLVRKPGGEQACWDAETEARKAVDALIGAQNTPAPVSPVWGELLTAVGRMEEILFFEGGSVDANSPCIARLSAALAAARDAQKGGEGDGK